jgi:hypothetical protein
VIKNSKIELDWEYEYHEDTDEIPTEEELSEYGRGYNPPEYFFTVKVADQEFGKDDQASGLLLFKDWLEIRLLKRGGEPFANEHYILTLPDGTTKEGDLDENGYVKLEDLPPGPCKVRFPNVRGVEVLA